MAMLLCQQFTCPPQDNSFLLEDDLGMYVPAQPTFFSNETSTKTPASNNSELDDLLACTSADLLNDWLSFPDFLSDSSLDFQPDFVYSPESASNCSSNPSSPSTSLTGQEPDDIFQILDGNHLSSCSPSVNKPSLDPNFYPTLAQSSVPTFFSGEVFSCDSPTFTSPSTTPPPPSASSAPIKKELPVLTSLLGKRAAPCDDGQSASNALAGKKQRVRKKLPHTVMKQRKKEQNKDAALRYRQRKKEQQDMLDQRCQVLETKNSELKNKVGDLTREIIYLKKLWQEVVAAKQHRTSRLLN